MIFFFLICSVSFLTIISLAKIINFNYRFDYIISLSILTLLSTLTLLLNIFEVLLFFKVILCFLFFYHLFTKKKFLNYFDYLYIIFFLFLLYFNFDSRFAKEDVFNGYGYLIKSLFLSSSLPHFNNVTNFNNFNFDLLSSFYYYFFLIGSPIFKENIVILSHNLFLIFCVFTIFNIEDFKNKKIINLLKFILIFFCLVGIFFQSGKNILSEEVFICFIFAFTVFLIENRRRISKSTIIIIFLFFFLLGFGKTSAFFLLIIPISIFFIYSINIKKASILIIGILAFVISYSINTSLNSYKNNTFLETERSMADIKVLNSLSSFQEHDEEYASMSIDDVKLLKQFYFSDELNRLILRYKFYNDNNKLFKEKIEHLNKTIFETEVYKASILPPVRYIINNYSNNFKFPRLSITLPVWILFILFLLLFSHFNTKNKLFKKISIYYLLIILIGIGLNISAVVEDYFRESEVIKDETYFYNPEFPAKDTSRYLGWSIFLSILILIYLSKKYYKNIYSKLLTIIAIFLIIVLPARSFGHLIKINTDKYLFKLDNKINNFRENFHKSCNDEKPILVFDYDTTGLRFMYFKYHFYNYNFLEFILYDEKTVSRFKLPSEKDIIDTIINSNLKHLSSCIIVPTNSLIDNELKYNKQFLSFKVYPIPDGNDKEKTTFNSYYLIK